MDADGKLDVKGVQDVRRAVRQAAGETAAIGVFLLLSVVLQRFATSRSDPLGLFLAILLAGAIGYLGLLSTLNALNGAYRLLRLGRPNKTGALGLCVAAYQAVLVGFIVHLLSY